MFWKLPLYSRYNFVSFPFFRHFSSFFCATLQIVHGVTLAVFVYGSVRWLLKWASCESCSTRICQIVTNCNLFSAIYHTRVHFPQEWPRGFTLLQPFILKLVCNNAYIYFCLLGLAQSHRENRGLRFTKVDFLPKMKCYAMFISQTVKCSCQANIPLVKITESLFIKYSQFSSSS